MTCADYELLIGDAVDGALEPAQQRALDAHLATCARCRALAEDFRTIRAVSQTLEPHVPPPHVWNRIAAAAVIPRDGGGPSRIPSGARTGRSAANTDGQRFT